MLVVIKQARQELSTKHVNLVVDTNLIYITRVA